MRRPYQGDRRRHGVDFEEGSEMALARERLAATEVLVNDRDAVLGNSLGRAMVGESIDQ